MTELDKVINELAQIYRPLVESIEAKPQLTKGRYGDYMLAIERLAEMLGKGQATTSVYISIGLALQRAGANKDGVKAALRIMGYL